MRVTNMAFDLSSRAVVEGIPADRDGFFPDAAQDGLYVRVQRGTKSWVIRYAVDGAKRQKSCRHAGIPGRPRPRP